MGNTWLKVFFIICDYSIIFYRIYSDNFTGKGTTYFQILSSPLNVLILGVYAKRWHITYFKVQASIAENLIDQFFACQKDLSRESILSERKHGCTGLISRKMEAL